MKFSFLLGSCAFQHAARTASGSGSTDTKPDTTIATRDGHREFAKHAPDRYRPHQQHRNEHGDQRGTVIEMMGKTDLAGALQGRRSYGFMPCCDMANDIFQHDDGVVNDKVPPTGSAPAASCC